MKPQDRFILTEQERESPLWKRLRAHYEKRLATMRAKNDGPIDHEQTLLLRGRINEVKTLLSLNDAIQLTSHQE